MSKNRTSADRLGRRGIREEGETSAFTIRARARLKRLAAWPSARREAETLLALLTSVFVQGS
jgi:hypothetical protein